MCQKLEDDEFLEIIRKYDVICLTECWISEHDDIILDNYQKHIFPCKIGRGGGIAIFVRNDFKDDICFVRNIEDCIVWFKFQDKLSNRVTHFAFCYLPPENSVFYDRGSDEIDLFQNLEDS